MYITYTFIMYKTMMINTPELLDYKNFQLCSVICKTFG